MFEGASNQAQEGGYMNNQVSKKQVRDSIEAAQRYIETKEACRGRHEAYVSASINGENCHGVRTVYVDITDDNVVIIIENLHTICNHNTNKFTPVTDDFSIINKTLQIRPKASLRSRVVIEITAK